MVPDFPLNPICSDDAIVIHRSPLNPAVPPVVMIDGKILKPEKMITMERDDMIKLVASGLKPGSQINFKVQKLGIPFLKDSYSVNMDGNIEETLDIPNMRLTVTCVVSYYDTEGNFDELKFKFRIR